MPTPPRSLARALLTTGTLLAALLIACGPSKSPSAQSPFQKPPAQHVDSDLGAVQYGGGCYPSSLHGSSSYNLDSYDRVNPSWVPVVDGSQPDSLPALMHGTVVDAHGDTGGDFPENHLSADVNADVELVPSEQGFVSNSNDVPGAIHLEWESGSLPAYAWPSAGDQVTALGRWIFDCGHPDPTPGHCAAKSTQTCVVDADCQPSTCPDCSRTDHCVGEHFHYGTEMHPPYAIAVSRTGRGGIVTSSASAKPTLATRTDLFVSPNGGAAGDRCVVTHDPDTSDFLFQHNCFPLKEPLVASYFNKWNFDVSIPLPARPAGASLSWRVVPEDAGIAVPAGITFTPHPSGSSPSLEVTVLLSKSVAGKLPSGYAATIFAGWNAPPPAPLTHVRLTLQGVTIRNPLRPKTPIAGEDVKTWILEASTDGEAQRLGGLGSVEAGEDVAEDLVFDQYLPPDGKLHFHLEGTVHTCIDTLFGQSFAADAAQVGLGSLSDCLYSTDPTPGTVDVSYPGPDFGSGSGTKTYDVDSTGSDGGSCSTTDSALCLTDADCPSGETCQKKDGAFTAHYRIEIVR